MNDPRQPYRVRLDEELARGDDGAWERYQNAAALCERPPEEWELERPVSKVEASWAIGQRAAIQFEISHQLWHLDPDAYRNSSYRAIRALEVVGVDRDTIRISPLPDRRDARRWVAVGTVTQDTEAERRRNEIETRIAYYANIGVNAPGFNVAGLL